MVDITPSILFKILQNIPLKHKQFAIDILLQLEADVESMFQVPKLGTMDIYTFQHGREKVTMIDYRWQGKVEVGLRKNNRTTIIWLPGDK